MSSGKGQIDSVYQMLSPRQRRVSLLLQVYFLIAGAFQVLGAGSIAPFVTVLSNPALVQENALIRRFAELFALQSENEVLVGLAVATMLLLLISNVLGAIGVWLTFRFSFWLGADIQRDLLASYLTREYVEIARENSSELIASILQGAARFTYNVMQPMLVLASQLMIVLAVILVLAIYNPAALLTFVLLAGGGYGLLFALVKRKLVSHGNHTWAVVTRKQRLLAEALGGLKEIRLAGIESKYYKEFRDITSSGQRSEAAIGLLGDLPRFVIETVAFCALLAFAIVMLNQGKPAGEIVEMLSVFAMTGYRVLPAAQSIFKSLSQIRSNIQVTDELLPYVLKGRAVLTRTSRNELDAPEPGVVQLREVTFRYPTSERDVLSNISVDIFPGELTVVVGSSGSGKSTLSDIVLGLLPPTSGTVLINGTPLHGRERAWQKSIGYVPQSIFLIDDSLTSNITFGTDERPNPVQLRTAVERASLGTFVDSLPEGMNYRVGERGLLLSGGQRQRVGLARALYKDSKVLVLDEATSALDGATESEVLKVLLDLRRDRVVLCIAHRASTIKAADRIIFIRNGALEAAGSYQQLVAEYPAFRRLVEEPELADATVVGSAS